MKTATVILFLSAAVFISHLLLLEHLSSSRVLENVMTNGASAEALFSALLFFLLRLILFLIVPAVLLSALSLQAFRMLEKRLFLKEQWINDKNHDTMID